MITNAFQNAQKPLFSELLNNFHPPTILSLSTMPKNTFKFCTFVTAHVIDVLYSGTLTNLVKNIVWINAYSHYQSHSNIIEKSKNCNMHFGQTQTQMQFLYWSELNLVLLGLVYLMLLHHYLCFQIGLIMF